MTDGEKLDLILSELQGVKNNMQGMESEQQSMKSDMQSMKSDMQSLKSDMQKLERKVAGIEVHLENVTDRNIRLIAEGHLDLRRKLDEALKNKNEKELLGIRLNILEDEIRKIKEQFAATAWRLTYNRERPKWVRTDLLIYFRQICFLFLEYRYSRIHRNMVIWQRKRSLGEDFQASLNDAENV